MTDMLKTGSKAPAFDLPIDGGKRLTLAELAGKQVVLYFYPKDDTPGCTVEAQDFARLHGEFEKAGAVVLGISKCSVKKHDKFKEKYCLPFPLLSDDAQVCEAYDVWKEKSMYGKKYMGIERSTFLIDAKGKIAHIWPKVKIEGHAEEVLETIRKG
ncbi:MAG: thioredoxin-dependent thiol peroxidase [Alphaproteobacteria bacterium]|nr:thioredoxin-dependent thiol peroxidase [Alphaproteobacteria bacterium]